MPIILENKWPEVAVRGRECFVCCSTHLIVFRVTYIAKPLLFTLTFFLFPQVPCFHLPLSSILFPLNWIPTSFHPGPKFLPQVQIPHVSWPSFKGPFSVKPFLNSSAGSNLSLIKSVLLLSTDGLTPFCMVLYVFMFICDIFGSLEHRCASKVSAGSPLSSVYTTPHKQIHTCPSTTAVCPRLHCLLLPWTQTPKSLLQFSVLWFSQVSAPHSWLPAMFLHKVAPLHLSLTKSTVEMTTFPAQLSSCVNDCPPGHLGAKTLAHRHCPHPVSYKSTQLYFCKIIVISTLFPHPFPFLVHHCIHSMWKYIVKEWTSKFPTQCLCSFMQFSYFEMFFYHIASILHYSSRCNSIALPSVEFSQKGKFQISELVRILGCKHSSQLWLFERKRTRTIYWVMWWRLTAWMGGWKTGRGLRHMDRSMWHRGRHLYCPHAAL